MEILQEQAIQRLPPLKLSNETDTSAQRERLRYFRHALTLLCHPETGCYKNVPVNEVDPGTQIYKTCGFNQKAVCLFELKETTCESSIQNAESTFSHFSLNFNTNRTTFSRV